ncbi:MAG: nucleoid-associated protein [Bacteroidales bacterium]|nr:nucleoid-associated protein [Bacteroidales bacterium]
MSANFIETTIENFRIHMVGNKVADEQYFISRKEIVVDNDLKTLLSHYFLSPFKSDEYYHFYHDVNLSLNEVYTYVSKIFNNPDSLNEQSVNLTKHLYNQSVHPKIKSGEFYVVYFKDCILNGETLDAVGLFKSENKDTFLEVEQVNEEFEIESRKGININKLDKGCLIFNTAKENGYVISIVDNTNKGNEAQYWKDDFLSVIIINNEYHQTNQFLGIAKQFVTEQLTEEYDVNKADQIDLLNRSVEYFKIHETFEKEDFEKEVFQDDGIINSFQKFNESYINDNDVDLSDNFEISSQAVKKQARVFKSVLKLDKNFHIYIHGDRKLIEQGVEKDGRKYYKIYYQDER